MERKMSDKINKKAIISVADKNGIVELCRELDRLGFEMIATGGTHKLLEDNGIKAVKISDYTGGSESERVKTLSQRIAREILETGEIGLVICNLYPFFDQQGKSIDEMIEFVDIGGVTLIRGGAKNFKKVGGVCDPNQYADIVRALKEDKFNEEYRLNLVRMAFDYIAWYGTIVASHFAGEFPDRIFFSNAAKLFIPFRFGENPH